MSIQSTTKTLRLSLIAALVLSGMGDRVAWAGRFADNVAAMIPHQGEDYSGEFNTDILGGAGEDAGCQMLPSTGCPDFSDSVLTDSIFSGARFDGADWSDGTILDTLFDAATFIQTDFAGARLDSNDFTGADFTDAMLRRAIVIGSDFAGATLDGADSTLAEIVDSTFDGATTFVGTDLDDIYLERVDFTDVDVSGVDMRRATVRGGQFVRTDFIGTSLRDSQFRCIADPDEEDDDPQSLCPDFSEADFTGADLTGSLFGPAFDDDEIVIADADFTASTLVDATWAALVDPCLQTSESPNTWSCLTVGPGATVDGLSILNDSDLRGSDWRNLTLSGFTLPFAHIAGARFADTVIDDADFRFTRTTCLPEEDADDADTDLCDFLETNSQETTDFTNADISDARFDDADLGRADFSNATLTDVVFDSADLGCSVVPDPDVTESCFDCANFAGAFVGQTALPHGAYNISAQGIDWGQFMACSVDQPSALIDDLSHVQLDGGSFAGADVSGLHFVGSSLQGVSFAEATVTGVMFDDANLAAASFDGAVNTCTTGCEGFPGADLTNANLSRTSFPTSSFDEADLDNAVAVNTDFTGATFDGTASSMTSMVGINVSTSDFETAMFSFADLTGATGVCDDIDDVEVCTRFTGIAFNDSLLVDANFSGADFTGATFPNSDLSGVDFGDANFDAGTRFENAQIDGIDLTSTDITGLTLLFANKLDFVPGEGQTADDAEGINLSAKDLTGFDFSGLDLRNWNFDTATLTGTDFSGVGAGLDGASFDSVQFDTTLASMTVDNDFFSGTELVGADLRGLDLSGFDLSGADLTGAIIENTDFSNADLSNTMLIGISQICIGTTDCATFTDAQLSCAEIFNTEFRDFEVPDLTDTQFFQQVDSDLSGLQLTQQTLRDYDLSNLDFTRANFDQGDVRLADFTGSNLNGTLFTNATVCATAGDADCPDFTSADLVGSTDCNDQEAVNFTGVSFINAPFDLFENTDDGTLRCVNFTNADLGLPEAAATATTGFDFRDFTDAMDFEGAVIAGASLQHQDFSFAAGFADDFFTQFAHAPASVDSLCSDEDDDVPDHDTTPDFTETDFSCAILSDKMFTGADMTLANLARTTLDDADFQDADLTGVSFAEVVFTDDDDFDIFQNLANAPSLETSDEDPPDRVDADGIPYPVLQFTDFSFADLSQTTAPFDLSHVDLTGATLNGANFQDVDLRDAIVDELTSLCGELEADGTACSPTDLTQACLDIDGAMVAGASFRGVQFGELFEFHPGGAAAAQAFFQNVNGDDLVGTNFTGAHLGGLDFSGLNLQDAALFAVGSLCDDEDRPAGEECARFTGATLGASDRDGSLVDLAGPTGRDFAEVDFAGAQLDHVNLSRSDFSDVGDLCTGTFDECLVITGEDTRLESVVFDGLDFTRQPGERGPFGADGTNDAVTRFNSASFDGANLSGLSLQGRDFTNVDFTAADLTNVVLDDSILESATFGCDGDDCSLLDGASLCGVDASAARFEGSLAGTDFSSVSCGNAAELRGASFVDSQLATVDLSSADLEGVTFASDVDFCDDTNCLTITGANLRGAVFAGVELDELPDDWFTAAGAIDLRESDFSNADASGKSFVNARFEDANFTGADLRDSDLDSADFREAQFAAGGSTNSGLCTLPSGGSVVDLRGADLSDADFSRARNFHRGCIRVDSTTLYSGGTRFPSGFDLITQMTRVGTGSTVVIPEPRHFVLQAAALLTLMGLAARSRRNR